jgi:hypothetical protein
LKNSQIKQLAAVSSHGFRDPGGRVFLAGKRVFRTVTPGAFATLQSFLATSAAKTLIESGQIVRTQIVEHEKLLEHDRIPFISYPYEWPPEMLYSAARLSLDIAQTVAGENWRLKDAHPYNVLFSGSRPVFVDLLSFEPLEHGEMLWPAYGQFLRTFLLPLLAHKSFGLTLRDVLLTRKDGLQPEDLYALSGMFRKLRPPVLSLVTIPTWLGRGHFSRPPAKPVGNDSGKARFVFEAILRRIARQLKSVSPVERKSAWSSYSRSIEDEPYYQAKLSFIRGCLDRYRPGTGLDVGCNTGDFSCLATNFGLSMVAIDSDPEVVGTVWRRAVNQNLDVLPLVVDIARPSPDLGWLNTECASFLSRARHRFKIVFLLAVMHHIAKDGIPLDEFVRLTHHLTSDLAVVELVEHQDPAFLDMVRGREEIFEAYSRQAFEAESASQSFEIVSRTQVRPARWLYLLRKAR